MSRAIIGAAVATTVLGLISVSSYLIHKNLDEQEKKKEEKNLEIPKRVIKAILFDMDGTLLESSEIWFELLKACVEHFGHPELTYDHWRATFGQSMAKNVELFMPGTPQADVDQYCYDNYNKHIEKIYLLDGALEAVQFANQVVKNKVFVVTNCPRPITSQILTTPAAGPLVDALTNNGTTSLNVICADDEVEVMETVVDSTGKSTQEPRVHKIAPKPKTDMVLEAARKLGVDPSECLLIGDSRYDIQCINEANGVGVGIGVENGAFMIKSVAEIAYLAKYLDFQ